MHGGKTKMKQEVYQGTQREVRIHDGKKRNCNIQVRVTINERERMFNNASGRGFATLSHYLRFLALDKDLVIDQKIIETHEEVKKIRNFLKRNKKSVEQLRIPAV
jgi:thermostable 8-oxoguanine DNA glycosylase